MIRRVVAKEDEASTHIARDFALGRMRNPVPLLKPYEAEPDRRLGEESGTDPTREGYGRRILSTLRTRFGCDLSSQAARVDDRVNEPRNKQSSRKGKRLSIRHTSKTRGKIRDASPEPFLRRAHDMQGQVVNLHL